MSTKFLKYLKEKCLFVRREILKIHKISKGIRIASCLSDVEIFVALYYGGLLNINPKHFSWPNRDRFIISKAHGSVSLYPIFVDLGYFDKTELDKIGHYGGILGVIPDSSIPGFDIVLGSLGHGLGVGCGIALALKKKNVKSKVFVLSGDGELYEGSVWESIMFAGHHKLDNLLLIIDRNERCMLDYCKNVIDLEPLYKKFEVFNWYVEIAKNGNDINEIYCKLKLLKEKEIFKPKVLIAYTTKGKSVPQLEKDPQCHIKSLTDHEIDILLEKLK